MFRGKKAKRGRKDTRKTGHRWRRNSSRVEKRERERKKKERERDERVGVSSSKVLIPERGAWGSGRQRPRERRWEKIGGNREREYFG